MILFADTWNLLLDFWASFITEKNHRENLQALFRSLAFLLPLLNIDILSKSKKETEVFSVSSQKDPRIVFSGRKKVFQTSLKRPETNLALKEQMPNFLKVSVAFTKLAPHIIKIVASTINEGNHEAKSTAASSKDAKVVHWVVEPFENQAPEIISPISEQVQSLFDEVEGIMQVASSESEPKKVVESIPSPRPEEPTPEHLAFDAEALYNVKLAINQFDIETRREFDKFLNLLKNVLQGIVSPFTVLVEKVPKELIELMVSFLGLLEDIVGPNHMDTFNLIIRWVISGASFLLDEHNLSNEEWFDNGSTLINEGKSLFKEISSLYMDPWLQNWIKRFREQFKKGKEELSARIPPIPKRIDFSEFNIYTTLTRAKEWSNYIFFELPRYLKELAWQFPMLLFPFWFKRAFKGPIPRIELRQKKFQGWIDNIESLVGSWDIALQSISKIYPKKDKWSKESVIEPWTPGLNRIPAVAADSEPVTRWIVNLDISNLLLRDARYFYKYKSRWFTLGFKKKAFADGGRLDIEMGRKKRKDALKKRGISIILELGVPEILGSPIISQPSSSSFWGILLTGIKVNVNDITLRVKSDKHPRMYPIVLPFTNSAIRRNMETLIKDETIRLING